MLHRLCVLKNLILFGYLCLFLVGCSSLPNKAINTTHQQQLKQLHFAKLNAIKEFNLKGRIAVNTAGKGYSGGLTWQHTPLNDQLAMFSPLGSKVSEITKSEFKVTLTTADGKQFSAVDAETLTENTLGWRLPLSGLTQWVIGLANNNASSVTLDELGRISTLQEDGWDIEYSQYSQIKGVDLPKKIVLRSPKVNLKLIVDEWMLPSQL